MKIHSIAVFLAFAFLLTACKKDEEEVPIDMTVPVVQIDLSHKVSGIDLVFNQRIFENAAGNSYEVRHLEYYIADFKLLNQGGSWVEVISEPYLINPEKGVTTTLMANVPVGNYTGLSCMIGIPVTKNLTGYLPNTLNNVNMAWPEPIGGGYHFMKFEGNYMDEKGDWRGFTVHLGKNGMQSVNVIQDVQFSISESSTKLELVMDMNEWFESPYLYDFIADGNYTMAIDSLMKLVSDNGKNCLAFKN
ncbi:MAG: hypothetical protein RIE58_04145 [Vicingaceae bacterium]